MPILNRGTWGGVYQAGNWVYVGHSCAQAEVMVAGKIMHKRSAVSKFGSAAGLPPSPVRYKHKYLMPLDDAMRTQIEPLRKPYPKRTLNSEASPPSEERQGRPDPSAPTNTTAYDADSEGLT